MRQNGFTITLLVLAIGFAVVGVLALIGASNYAADDWVGLAARWSAVGAFALQSAVIAFLVWLGANAVIRALAAPRIQPPPPPAS